MFDESQELKGERFVLEYSKRTPTWALHSPSDYRRAWRQQSLYDLVEVAAGASLMYRYDIEGHDSDKFQPHAHSFEGVLLAVAGHPYTFSIPERLQEDYSQQQLEFVSKWQKLLVGGLGGAEPPIDAQSLSFKEALHLMDEAGRFDEKIVDEASVTEIIKGIRPADCAAREEDAASDDKDAGDGDKA